MPPAQSLQDIVRALLHPSPDTPKPRPANRRVRVDFNSKRIVDTVRPAYVWEHPYYPQFYLDERDFVGVERNVSQTIKEKTGTAELVTYTVGDRKFEGVKLGEGKWWGGEKLEVELKGLVRVGFRDMDAWYEEDSRIYVHPRDPTKRIFLLPSTRSLVIKLGSHTLVDSANASYIHLIEPLLPVRYYVPQTLVSPAILRPSATQTQCPYKGTAEYYDVVLKDENGHEKVYTDLVWYYTYPTLECAAIAGMLCFYNEKVDVWVDGVQLEKPKSPFA